MAARAAGINRRNRRPQNARRATRPVPARSASNNDVIKNPDRVKNVETPKNPPRAHENPEWNNNTAATATPRNPSTAGKYGNRPRPPRATNGSCTTGAAASPDGAGSTVAASGTVVVNEGSFDVRMPRR